LSGEINQLALGGKEAEAEALTTEFRDLFGKEHFWLELQRNGIEDQTAANEVLTRIHGRTGIPLVATNDIHYLRQEDCAVQDVLLCINTGARKDDPDRFKFDATSLYFTTREQMGEMFKDLPEALKSTMDVASQTEVELEFGTYHLPIFKSDTGEAPDEIFARLLDEGLNKYYGKDNAAARERLEYEKATISELGFVSYFLIVWDLIRWARAHDIHVGPGRGSAAGSIVAYLLDITRLDPLEYGLIFERFLNSARVSMPDIDIDFCKEGRERVMEYTRERYGSENVAQIVTFGTMASRTVVRDVGRVLDVPLREVDRIAKKIPQGPGAPALKEALETDSDLIAIRQEKPEYGELFRYSVALEGMARHISTHAAGVVIADRPIVDYVPLAKNGDDITTQWSAGHLEELGLLKMDYLGLRTLTILDRALANIKLLGDEPPDLEDLPENDAKVFEFLTSGDTLGVFQLESEGMRKLLHRLKPDCFEDLIAVLALYRPGPLESGMADMFVRRKHGEEEVVYPHASVEEILEETHGCIVYQEQVMMISNRLANFSLNDADNLRKAMGKKKPEIMEKFSAQFLAGALANGCAKRTAKEVWDNIVKFGGYGFNKSHSTAYARITYQTAYLKTHHRKAFLAANMSCEMSDTGKVKELVDDSRRASIDVLPPDIRYSRWEFLATAEGIRYGFGALKGTGSKAVELLLSTRDSIRSGARPIGLHQLCSELDPPQIGRLTFEALIKAGAFEATGHNRGAVLAALDSALSDGARAAADRRSGQGSLFGASPDSEAPAAASDGIDASRALNRSDTLTLEFEALGYYLTGHPLEERAGLVALLSSTATSELPNLPHRSEVVLTGLVMGKSEVVVRSGRMAGRKMGRFRLEDLQGAVGVTCFPDAYEASGDLIEDGAVVVCRGKLESKDDEVGLLLDEILSLDQALQGFSGGLLLHLSPTDGELLSKLRACLATHSGNCPVYLQVTGDDGRSRRIRAGREFQVSLSDPMAEELVQLVGRERVCLTRF
jgi:DNA polymerase-3 subunit alpha